MIAESDPAARLLLKLEQRDVLSEREREIMRAAVAEVQEFPAGKTFVRRGAALSQSTLLVSGMVGRYRDLSEGQRQIMELHVAGDFVDLHGFLLKRLEHNIGALTRVTVAFVPHDRLKRITEDEPHLARLLWLSTLMDAAIQRERILSIGRRNAAARIAHLVCELYVRLESIGLAQGQAFALPLTQLDIADATGLTSVHVNRMLRRLRDEGLLTLRGGEARIHDWERLKAAAEFDDAYLYLDRRPR
jgi:CRP-like cAMP-binding protein